MEVDSTSFTTSMDQESVSFMNRTSNHNFTLFDQNLHRINEKLKSANQYFTPKYEYLVENDSKLIETKEMNELLDEPVDQSINFYNEFHKITMNEIESMRKTYVQKMLNKKAHNWEDKRKERFNTPSIKNEEVKRKLLERLTIDKNYTRQILDSNDQLQARLREKQNMFDQKTRDIKFALALKIASSSLNDIKKVLSESHMMSLLSTHVNNVALFEVDLKKFQNVSQNSTECDLAGINRLVQNIQNLNEQIVKCMTKKTQVENVSFISVDHNEAEKNVIENFTFKTNENYEKANEQNSSLVVNHSIEEPKNELHSFTFNIDKNSGVQSDEFLTYKFKTDEDAANNIENFSFSMKDKAIKNNTSYTFENDYKQFLENHLTIQKHLNEFENLYYSFLHDDSLKSLRQELTKSINTPVNSISSVSSWHMKDKFDKLDALLNCKTVKTGNSTVSANSHKDALHFCKDKLAKKIINIGEEVASVKTETAFEVASVVTELWQTHPDFGLLLYARFKQKCPCLVPYNASKLDEETDEEYYKSLGYNYTNGTVEKQDKYIKRMTGIIRLFAAIIVTETKSGKALGIAQAWMLIAATVNLTPQLDVTAVLLHEMLAITGYYLKRAYGKQFIKMLRFIDTNYMKKIDEVTPIGCGGPVQRLKTFISNFIQTGHVDKPRGLIPHNFW